MNFFIYIVYVITGAVRIALKILLAVFKLLNIVGILLLLLSGFSYFILRTYNQGTLITFCMGIGIILFPFVLTILVFILDAVRNSIREKHINP